MCHGKITNQECQQLEMVEKIFLLVQSYSGLQWITGLLQGKSPNSKTILMLYKTSIKDSWNICISQ